MSDVEVGSFIELMKIELGVELDRELAAELGISPTAIAGWRSRNRVPSKYIVRFARRKDEIADNGGGDQPLHRLRSAYVFRLIDAVSRRLFDNDGDGFGSEFNEMWRGYRLADAYYYFADMLAGEADKDALRAAYQALRSEVETDDFINWIENLGT